MSQAVLDPTLLLYPECDGASVDSIDEYLDRMSDWMNCSFQVGLAPAGLQYVLAQFVKFGYPELSLPLGSGSRGRLTARLIGSLLRESIGDGRPRQAEIVEPHFCGEDELGPVAASDVAHAIDNEAACFASSRSHWSHANGRAYISDGGSVELLFDPSREVCTDRFERTTKFYQNRKLIIVGGLEDRKFVQQLQQAGVAPAKLKWVELESSVSAGLVKQRLSGVDGDRYVIACWTGRIGHDGSDAAKKKADSAGAIYVLAETLPDMIEQLLSIAA